MFYQQEPPKKCKFLKNLFSKCHSFRPVSIPEEAEPVSDFDEQDKVFVSAIVGKYIESKCKRKSHIAIDSFKLPPSLQAIEKQSNCGGENREEFLSACSRLSRCSSSTSFGAFISVKTRFSRSSSLNEIDFNQDFFISKQSVIREKIARCEGWPFGLCRKALLVPPLLKSPSNSWSWRNSGRRRVRICE